MHTYLIIGGDLSSRTEEIARQMTARGIHEFDCITPELTGPTIGITEIRAFIKALSLRPTHGNVSAGIIPQAELLTQEAQQALLKTLEEPPAHANLILAVANDAALLPTVVSRCVKIPVTQKGMTLQGEVLKKTTDFLTNLMMTPVGERIAFCETVGKSKDEILMWIDTALVLLGESIRDTDTTGKLPEMRLFKTRLIHRLLQAKQRILGNIHPLLALEHALITDDAKKDKQLAGQPKYDRVQ